MLLFFVKTMTLKIVLWLFGMNSNATMRFFINMKHAFFFVKLSEKRQICKGAVSLICQPIFENLDVQLIVETREMQWNWLQINVSIKKDFHFFPFLCELWWGEKKKNWLSESKILFLQILFHYKFNRMNIASHDDPSLRCNNFDLFLENHVRGCFDSCKKIRKTYWWKYFWHISSFF